MADDPKEQPLSSQNQTDKTGDNTRLQSEATVPQIKRQGATPVQSPPAAKEMPRSPASVDAHDIEAGETFPQKRGAASASIEIPTDKILAAASVASKPAASPESGATIPPKKETVPAPVPPAPAKKEPEKLLGTTSVKGVEDVSTRGVVPPPRPNPQEKENTAPAVVLAAAPKTDDTPGHDEIIEDAETVARRTSTIPMGLVEGRAAGHGRYKLVKELGRGGMGVVWLAMDKNDDFEPNVALKFLPLEISRDPMALGELRRETARGKHLTHKNILRTHELFEPKDEPPFISMEFVDGKTFRKLLSESSEECVEWEFLRPLMIELCEALDHAHTAGIIHRDLKPANLMYVTGGKQKGQLKLADFGIAAILSDSMTRNSQEFKKDSKFTSGTLPYMSPQQLDGLTPRKTDDIYSLGATICELLTGKPPFFRGGVEAVKHQIFNVQPTSLQERLSELGKKNKIPDYVNKLVQDCLAKDAAQRPQSAREVAERLKNAGAQPAAAAPVAVIQPTPPAPQPRSVTPVPSLPSGMPTTYEPLPPLTSPPRRTETSPLLETPPEPPHHNGNNGQSKSSSLKGLGWLVLLLLAIAGVLWFFFGNNGQQPAPTIAITSPAPGEVTSNKAFSVTGHADDKTGVESVYYQLNGSSWMQASSADNWSNWKADVNLTEGKNTVQAYAVATGGKFSTTNTVTWSYSIPTTVTPIQEAVHVATGNPGETTTPAVNEPEKPITKTDQATDVVQTKPVEIALNNTGSHPASETVSHSIPVNRPQHIPRIVILPEHVSAAMQQKFAQDWKEQLKLDDAQTMPLLSDYLRESFTSDTNYFVLERAEFDTSVMKELDLANNAHADQQLVDKVGKLLNADYIIVPEIQMISIQVESKEIPYRPDPRVTLKASLKASYRLVEVQTSRILLTKTQSKDVARPGALRDPLKAGTEVLTNLFTQAADEDYKQINAIIPAPSAQAH